MNLIATGTVIRGKGECQAFVNGVAQMDIHHQQERWMTKVSAEMERLRMAEKSRNRMAKENLELKRAAQKTSMIQRLCEYIEDSWALAFGTFVVWGEELGLWVIEDNEG